VLCEAASSTGLGHFVRSVSLARELAARGARVEVLLRPDALPRAREAVTTAGLELACGDWDPALPPAGPAADLVVDSYRVSGAWLTAAHQGLRATGGRLTVLDDLADRSFTADVVVNQNLGAEQLSYPGAGTVLAGPGHALLRPEFPAARATGLASAHELPDLPRSVLVLFGGTDPTGMTGAAARAALAAFPGASVRVVRPAEAAPDAELAASPRVTLLPSRPDVHRDMLDADLVVTAGGTTLWELCCLARPAAVVAVADNQRAVYDGMGAGGYVLPLGRRPEPSVAVLADRLAGLLAEPGRLRQVALAAATVTDGRGTARVADVLMG
jgi:UDP-2,4-diacetamido-2,4,6-trideoxy-beta-L-altropyranose hydrolase